MTSIINSIKAMALGTSEGPLFEPVKIGRYDLKVRYIYAPLTRCRALGNIPQHAAIKYYSDRARDGAFMVTEATAISQQGQGYPCVPGIHSQEQVEGWKPIVKAVHDKGGVFFLQLWHVGRSSHAEYQENGQAPVAPSAIAIKDGQVYAPKSGKMADYPVPRALDMEEIPGIIQQATRGARNAIAAGFDGVEIHFANGYLFDQFLKTSSNKRTDRYGGSIENRCRLALETLEAVVKEVGADRVGIRLSPYNWDFQNCHEADVESTVELNVYLLKQINELNIAYVHIVSSRAAGSTDAKNPDLEKKNLKPFREAFNGPIIAAGGYKKDTAEAELKEGTADLVCFGRWYLANPDFPERLRDNKPFNKYNRDTFYTQDQVEGYNDYPFLKDIPADTPTEEHYSGQLVFKPDKQKVRTEDDVHGH